MAKQEVISAENFQKLAKKKRVRKKSEKSYYNLEKSREYGARYKANHPDWKENLNNAQCEVCKKPFYAIPSHLAKGQSRFCSRGCRSIGCPQKKNFVPCKGCGKPMQVKPCAVRAEKGKTYCSVSCRTKKGSYLEAMFAFQLAHDKSGLIPEFKREFRFHPTRRWRFDFAWIEAKIAVEIQGGLHLGKHGGHTSFEGRRRDMEKNNEAVIAGWRVFQFGKAMIKDGTAMHVTLLALGIGASKSYKDGKGHR